MKTIDEILTLPHLIVSQYNVEGGHGRIIRGKLDASVIFTWGAGWDHVSIAPYKRNYVPTWDDMCYLKEMFFYPQETVLQYHPAESEYVNQLGNCLHLWRPQDFPFPLPPKILVGMQRGMSSGEFDAAIKEAYEHPYALTSDMLEKENDHG